MAQTQEPETEPQPATPFEHRVWRRIEGLRDSIEQNDEDRRRLSNDVSHHWQGFNDRINKHGIQIDILKREIEEIRRGETQTAKTEPAAGEHDPEPIRTDYGPTHDGALAWQADHMAWAGRHATEDTKAEQNLTNRVTDVERRLNQLAAAMPPPSSANQAANPATGKFAYRAAAPQLIGLHMDLSELQSRLDALTNYATDTRAMVRKLRKWARRQPARLD